MTDTTAANGGEELTPEAREQLAHAVDTALKSPQQAQGFLSSIPDLSGIGGAKDKVLKVIDTVLAAINTVQQYSWALGSYADDVQKIEDALTKVKGWLD